jgi:hypothetical protein
VAISGGVLADTGTGASTGPIGVGDFPSSRAITVKYVIIFG